MKGLTLERQATCLDCPWSCEAANAQGMASQHAERHEHRTQVRALIEYDGRPNESRGPT